MQDNNKDKPQVGYLERGVEDIVRVPCLRFSNRELENQGGDRLVEVNDRSRNPDGFRK